MGALMRSIDWARTPLGPIERWPQSLRTSISICLSSRFPILVWWGLELVMLYNDAYRPMLGATKHPRAMGRPGREVWPEVWPIIGPMLEGVLARGEATWSDDQLLLLDRNGFLEECYFTFSYSPIRDESGGVGGVFCAVTETTGRVLGERRLQTLRALAEPAIQGKTAEEACALALRALADNPHDLPFALLYLLDEEGREARLCDTVRLAGGTEASPATVRVDGEDDVWSFRRALATGQGQTVDTLEELFGRLPAGPWADDWTKCALVLPLARAGAQELPAGFLVAGVSPRLVFDGDYRGFLGLAAGHIATAIADARAYEEERRRAEALAELDRAKTAFFSNVSHELRTPLTLLLGPLEDALARPDGLPAADRERLEVAHRNALRLLKLVNTLLDFSRIEAGRIEASYEPVDLAGLTADLASVFRAAVERAGLRLLVDCPPLDQPVWVNREMWEKIVLNLLSNAFKFTFEGEIEVSLRRAGEAVELSVRDSGTGIPAGELPHLFERFHRVKGARGRTFEGSGIGLALVQELVKLHGGAVRAESEVDRGSRFVVSIPLGKAHLPADRVGAARATASTGLRSEAYAAEALWWLPREAAEIEPLLAGPPASRVLLADDNADMREYVRRLLGARYEVEAVADGSAALRAARERRPDLVLTDVMMPGLDGFALLGELRADERLRTVPVIMLSARAGEEARIEGLESGADDYLIKPFSAKELLARVATHLGMAQVRKRAEQALREADRRKDEFLAMLAHELRNPLAPIRNAAQVLKLVGDGDAKQRWAREVIERQTQHLTRLVDDLLDVSRITQGKVKLAREPLDLSAVVQRAVEASRPLIDARRHHLTVVPPPEPVRLAGDLTRLVQVVGNLLNNAAKYTDEGGHIRVEAAREGAEAVLRVRDDGMGIPPDLLPHVFDLFIQADRSLDRSQGGLGIGLTLVRQLVELHGGRVEARSAGFGQGSELTVRLPAASPGAAEGVEAVAGESAQPAPRALKILLVEDNLDSAEMMTFLLTLGGHEVRTAHDGREALEAARAFLPQAVLCDIGLPGMNGYELAARLREQPDFRRTPLIALTGYGEEESRRRSREAGFDYHLVKPVEPAALDALLDSLLAEAGGQA